MGHYQFRVLAMGLANSCGTFQQVMSTIFVKQLYKTVLVYVDDILVMSKDAASHERDLAEVLQILQDEQLFVRAAKCKWEQTTLKFLGFVVGADGIKVDPGKVEVVKKCGQNLQTWQKSDPL